LLNLRARIEADRVLRILQTPDHESRLLPSESNPGDTCLVVDCGSQTSPRRSGTRLSASVKLKTCLIRAVACEIPVSYWIFLKPCRRPIIIGFAGPEIPAGQLETWLGSFGENRILIIGIGHISKFLFDAAVAELPRRRKRNPHLAALLVTISAEPASRKFASRRCSAPCSRRFLIGVAVASETSIHRRSTPTLSVSLHFNLTGHSAAQRINCVCESSETAGGVVIRRPFTISKGRRAHGMRPAD